jgi:hypothetical protein
VLSTINAIVHRRERKQALSRDVLVSGNARPTAGDPLKSRYTITAVNMAVRPVEIARVGVIGTGGLCVWYGPQPRNLPAHLEDGQSVTVEVEEEWINLVRDSTQQEIIGFAAEDSLGFAYRSESAPEIVDIAEIGFVVEPPEEAGQSS